ncbi:hypothetical protein KSP39_PZI004626 [Platanthera zijinensis]|uniref:Aminotransferase-like plant mobile domain-containing protein n=1 Tax=Platanthera zijinensis TaxID=2320716 RepID=A0AAP0BVH7_9ASPA
MSAGIIHLFNISSAPQNTPILYAMVQHYNSSTKTFSVCSSKLKFTRNEVAMIIGLPNQGHNVEYQYKSFSVMTKMDLKSRILQLAKEDHVVEEGDLKTILLHVLCTLFFPCSCNRIPEEFIRLADPEVFKNYNWPRAIHGYLLDSLDTLAKKQKSPPEAMGYLNGCTHVLLIWIFEHLQLQIPTFPERRPRINRWTSIKTFALTRAMSLLQNIETTQVYVICHSYM